MLTLFRAINYACLKDVKVSLTPLHAFIGPNDSGKSTLLRAIRQYMTKPRSPSSPARPPRGLGSRPWWKLGISPSARRFFLSATCG